MPVALALHGRLAGWQPTWAAYQTKPGRGSNWDIEPHSTLGGFARFVHSTIWERIVVANRRAGLQLDVYIHSWNPEIGPLLDRLYRPNRSRHDPIRIGLDKVASQHLSIKRVLELCADEVHAHVLVMRQDVIWYEDFVLTNLSSAPLWLPHWCLSAQLTPQLGQRLRPACAAEQHGYLGESFMANEKPIASSPQLHMTWFGRAPLRHSAVDQHYIVLDWWRGGSLTPPPSPHPTSTRAPILRRWFVATPAVARTFGAIYDEFEAYRRGVLAVGPFSLWTHVFWADAALPKESPPSMAAAPNQPAPTTQPQSPSPNHPAPITQPHCSATGGAMKGPAACLRTQPRPPLETAASAAWLPQLPPRPPCASSRARPAGLPHTARAGRGGGDTFHTAPWPRLPAGSVKAARPKGCGRVWEGVGEAERYGGLGPARDGREGGRAAESWPGPRSRLEPDERRRCGRRAASTGSAN